MAQVEAAQEGMCRPRHPAGADPGVLDPGKKFTVGGDSEDPLGVAVDDHPPGRRRHLEQGMALDIELYPPSGWAEVGLDVGEAVQADAPLLTQGGSRPDPPIA